jgi:hypothetical protein
MLLVFKRDGVWRIPRLMVPQGKRPSLHIQAALDSMWGVSVFVVDYLSIPTTDYACVVAELLREPTSDRMTAVRADELDPADLHEAEKESLQRIVTDEVASPIGHIGWIDQAIAWVTDTTGERRLSKCDVEQHNAGGGFALLRLRSLSGRSYWLKATGCPNAHERGITRTLARACSSLTGCSSYVPTLLAERADWNAWLMKESATSQVLPQSEAESLKAVCDIASALAALQQATLPYVDQFLSSGACDHRYAHLRAMTPALFAYLHVVLDALDERSSNDAERLRFLEEALLDILERLEASPIPTSLVHADLNWGNILLVPHAQFIDWSEAYIGNPATSLNQLIALFQSAYPLLGDRLCSAAREAYLSDWKGFNNADWRDNLHCAQVTSLLTLLFGRFHWMSSESNTPRPDGRYLRFLTEKLYDAVTSQKTGLA